MKAGSGRLYRRNNSMLIRSKEEPHEISTDKNGIPPVYIPICARPKTEMTDTGAIQKHSPSPAKSAANSEVIQRTRSGREIKKNKGILKTIQLPKLCFVMLNLLLTAF